MSPRAPKGSQKGAKWSEERINGSQKEAKERHKGTKREPNGDQNASKSRPSEKVTKKEPKCSHRLMLFGAVLDPFSMTNR